jgi:hypothetical protein
MQGRQRLMRLEWSQAVVLCFLLLLYQWQPGGEAFWHADQHGS